MDLKDVSRNEINKRRNDKMNETFKDKSFMEGKPMNMLDLSITDYEKKEEKVLYIKTLEKEVIIII